MTTTTSLDEDPVLYQTRRLRAYRDNGPILQAAGALLRGRVPDGGRLDWLVPPLVRGIEYGCLAVLGFAHGVSAPLIYVLIAVLAYHHYDTVYRTRQKLWPPDWVFRAGLGWEGRLLVVAFAALAGVTTYAYAALAVYLGLLFGVESVVAWVRADRTPGATADAAAADAAEDEDDQ